MGLWGRVRPSSTAGGLLRDCDASNVRVLRISNKTTENAEPEPRSRQIVRVELRELWPDDVATGTRIGDEMGFVEDAGTVDEMDGVERAVQGLERWGEEEETAMRWVDSRLRSRRFEAVCVEASRIIP